MNTEITSKENPLYKEFKKTSTEKNDYLFIEGKKLFSEAYKSKLKIENVMISEHNMGFLSDFNLKDSTITLMTNDLIASLFSTERKPDNDDLIICLAKAPIWKLNDLFYNKKPVLFLDRIQDPGNLGTIVRSSLAFEAGGILLSSNSAYPFSTKVIRASAGAVFSLPLVFVEKNEQLKQISKEFSYKLIAMVKGSSQVLEKNKSKKSSIFLFGNEGNGLSKDILDLADESITIPQSDKVESLNLATSASIVLWNNYG